MKSNHLVAAIALTFAAASGPVLAQQATYEYPQALSSQTTRAAVLADLKSARAEGTVLEGENSGGKVMRFVAPRDREVVRAEARQATRSGLIAALTAEPQGFDVVLPRATAVVAVAAS